MNIGVTINIKDGENIWINGIAQNVINFVLLLNNSKENYNVFVLNTSKNNNLEYNLEGINVLPISQKINELDIIFILGSQITDEDYNIIKGNGGKVIFYSCGASYIVEMENILFKTLENENGLYKHQPDEIWVIPQNYKTNKYYFETIYNVEVKKVPFIWSPIFIDYIIKNTKIDPYYKPSNDKKRISCFEPNINVVKFSMYDILIVEQLYRKHKDLIKHFYVTNTTDGMKKSKNFNSIVNTFELYKDGIMSFENRYRMPYFLSEYTDVVISHQWENPLNYAYLDALYLNYPLVHNAYLIKDSGYFYNEFNVDEGKNMLFKSIVEHDNNIEEYNKRSQKTLNEFLPTNINSIQKYDNLIKKLFNNE